ncbi:MAG: hypothetical protein RIS82_883 [Actinomycetota bacterium]
MDFTQINWLAVFVASIAGFVIGGIWFGPKTFYPIWWKLNGNEPVNGPDGSNPLVLFGSTYVATLAQATTVAVLVELGSVVIAGFGAWEGLATGALVGAGVAAASSLSHRLFARQGFGVWIIEVGQDIVSLAAMGLIIGGWL